MPENEFSQPWDLPISIRDYSKLNLVGFSNYVIPFAIYSHSLIYVNN